MNLAGDLLDNDGRKFLEIMERLSDKKNVLSLSDDEQFASDLEPEEDGGDETKEAEEQIADEMIDSDDSLDFNDEVPLPLPPPPPPCGLSCLNVSLWVCLGGE